MKQSTIGGALSFEGIGIHSGLLTRAEIHPADQDSGIFFVHKGQRVDALVSNVSDTKRGTNLKNLMTVEHILSAINGCGIDNAEIVMESEELPILDGSAKGFVSAIRQAGIKRYEKERSAISVSVPVEIDDNGCYIGIFPDDHLSIEATIEYPGTIIGIQTAIFDETSNDYAADIAPARTFGLLREAEMLRKNGLAKGASFANAVVVTDDGYSSPLRFPDELARHKILDIMGDISLSGKKINGRIVSRKAGHRLNIELVRRIING